MSRHYSGIVANSRNSPGIFARIAAGLFIAFIVCRLNVRLSAAEAVNAISNSNGTVDLLNASVYRGPVDLVLADDESWTVLTNELSSTLSMVDLRRQRVVDEISCGQRPRAIALLDNGEILVSCYDAGVVQRFAVQSTVDDSSTPSATVAVPDSWKLELLATIETGFHPLGIAVDRQRARAFVGLVATGEVAEIDLQSNEIVRRLPVGRWPRYLALSPDGRRLAVGLSGDSHIAVLDPISGQMLYEEPLSGGINIGHLRCSADGNSVYFPWMIYRTNPINVRNIQLGWVLASRIGRVRLDGPAYREAISLDVPRLAVADPHGLALTPNEHRLAVTSSGTHELLVYRLQDLPFVGAGGPGDLIDPQLTRDDDLFYRLELGGRPMGLAARQDNKSLLCANYTLDTLQVIDIEARKVVHSIPLGTTPDNPSAREIHRGMEIFYDAERSLDQWYSCHSCHLDGGSNAKPMDTWNDGTELTPKTVIPLFGSTETAPWTWHGWQEDYVESLQNSFVTTMQGKSAPPEDLAALQAYLKQLEPSPNPFRRTSEVSQQAVARGRELFTSSEIGCADCHSGPSYTDGKIHDVGLSGESDKYDGFNTPSLINVYHKVRLLHDGRARTLKDVLSKWHKPEEIGGGGTLSPSQLDDLIQYLQTL